MDDPQHAAPVVHITGTNGKGSTAQIVTRLLMAQGLTVGTYTSPHLQRVNERIARDGEPISDDELAEQLAAMADLEVLTGVRPSYFELCTAAAFRWFADVAVEAAEQCNRTTVPEICEPVSLDALLKGRDAGRTLYFADEDGGTPAADAFKPGPATILTGPEGGFTAEEREAIRAADNAVAISLGPRILRAETAALAAVTTWMALSGDWR